MIYLILNTILYTSVGVVPGPTFEVAKNDVLATIDGTVLLKDVPTKICFVTVGKAVHLVKSECINIPLVVKE